MGTWHCTRTCSHVDRNSVCRFGTSKERHWGLARGAKLDADLGCWAARLICLAILGAMADDTGIGGSHAVLGDGAAIRPGVLAWRGARLARNHTNLRQRAADLTFPACGSVILAGCLCWEEAGLGVRAAVFITLAVSCGVCWLVVEVKSHLDRSKAMRDS